MDAFVFGAKLLTIHAAQIVTEKAVDVRLFLKRSISRGGPFFVTDAIEKTNKTVVAEVGRDDIPIPMSSIWLNAIHFLINSNEKQFTRE